MMNSELKYNNELKYSKFKNLKDTFILMSKLALRNIFANKRRNIVIFAIFTSVVTILSLFLAFGDGVVANFRNGFQALNNPRADIIATRKGYADIYKTDSNSDKLRDLTVESPKEIREKLLKLDYVKDAYLKTTSINLDLFVDNSKYKNLSFRGIDSSMKDYLLSKVDIVEGSMIKEGDENVLLLNVINKEELKVKPGDKITVLGSDLFHHVVTEDFKVAGYYRPKIDTPFFNAIVFTDMKGFNAVSGYMDNEANFINIDLKQGQDMDAAVVKLNQWAIDNKINLEFNYFGNIYVQNDEKYGAGRKMIHILTYIVVFFVMIGIVNMILINLFDRRKEIGTYYCIGAEKSLLMGVYTLELLIINVVATIVGAVLGFGLQIFINSLKISSTNPGIQIAFGGNVFHIAINFSSIVMLLISVIFITLIISLVALRSSLKVSPIVALHQIEE